MAACTIGARAITAQAPAGADRLAPGAVAEWLTVMRRLDDSVNRGRNDAATWYHRGMIAWALWERSRHTPAVKGLDWTSLAPRADTSLRRALERNPENEEYFQAVARFLLATGVSFRLYGPYGIFNDRLANARKSGDAERVASAALEAGRKYWLRWDELNCGIARIPPDATTARCSGARNGSRYPPHHVRDPRSTASDFSGAGVQRPAPDGAPPQPALPRGWHE